MVRFDTALTVRTRNGHDITSAVPELAVRPPVLDGSSAVVDGELVAGAGTPEDFDGIAGRVASRRRAIPHATTTPNRVGDPELGRA